MQLGKQQAQTDFTIADSDWPAARFKQGLYSALVQASTRPPPRTNQTHMDGLPVKGAAAVDAAEAGGATHRHVGLHLGLQVKNKRQVLVLKALLLSVGAPTVFGKQITRLRCSGLEGSVTLLLETICGSSFANLFDRVATVIAVEPGLQGSKHLDDRQVKHIALLCASSTSSVSPKGGINAAKPTLSRNKSCHAECMQCMQHFVSKRY